LWDEKIDFRPDSPWIFQQTTHHIPPTNKHSRKKFVYKIWREFVTSVLTFMDERF